MLIKLFSGCSVPNKTIIILIKRKKNIGRQDSMLSFVFFKGIVLRDFEWLQMILMNRLCVTDVPLEVYSFLKLHLHRGGG